MGKTWYDDDGSIPREEWAAKPQATLEDVQAAENDLRSYLEREENKRKVYYDNRREEAFSRMDEYEDRYSAIENKKEMEKREAEKKFLQLQLEEDLLQKKIMHYEAVKEARKRYEEKNFLFKLFHKKLTVKRAASLSTEEVNNLYVSNKSMRGK